ncbi:mechanosensitive ion channel domain-containing protein [Sungkyunkwania multivorans]|uniref:Mechanosensitive ion channel domain-containing protein n=1 Tax=Sungkyunkwania multivorans TaxID=1173618 RepID=A0ABW3CVP4_9FLAO
MNEFITAHKDQLIQSGIILVVIVLIRVILRKTVKKIGQRSDFNEARMLLMGKYFNFLFLLTAIAIALLIWGVNFQSLGVILSSVFAVVGVALFAIWSILSNITAGVILFFSFPYKIGDKIKIHDKDHPIEALIEDIKSFHLLLRTDAGEIITYPNNLLLQKAVSIVEKDAYQDDGSDSL